MKTLIPLFLVFLIALGFFTSIFSQHSDSPTSLFYSPEKINAQFGKFLILGDTQKTSRFEKWVLRREENSSQTKRLISSLPIQNSDFLIHLGDTVFDAGDRKEWKTFDEIFRPIYIVTKSLKITMANLLKFSKL